MNVHLGELGDDSVKKTPVGVLFMRYLYHREFALRVEQTKEAAAHLRYPSAAMGGWFRTERVGGADGVIGGDITGFERS